ncbi:MAG: LPS export ABC transporter ATP-binding protein [bacterium JZ-2024 1]
MTENQSGLVGKGLAKRFGRRWVVNGVDLEIHRGKIVGLLGPNGAGKTTCFYMITGLLTPTRGRVFFGEQDITRMPVYRRARLGLGYLAQEPSAFRKLTVYENLMVVLELIEPDSRKRRETVERLLEEFGLTELRRTLAYSLSGGERRRVEVARALTLNPSFLLLDEPFTGVDPIAISELKEIILNLRRSRGIGILLTDHNVAESLSICDYVYIMHQGKILAQGESVQVAQDPVAKEYYLGRHFRVPDHLLNASASAGSPRPASGTPTDAPLS